MAIVVKDRSGNIAGEFNTREEANQFISNNYGDPNFYGGALDEVEVLTPEARAANRLRVETSYYGSNSPAGHYRFLDRIAMSNPANPYDAATGWMGMNAMTALGAFDPAVFALSLGGYHGGREAGSRLANSLFDNPDQQIKINVDTYTSPRGLMSEGTGLLLGGALTGGLNWARTGMARAAYLNGPTGLASLEENFPVKLSYSSNNTGRALSSKTVDLSKIVLQANKPLSLDRVLFPSSPYLYRRRLLSNPNTKVNIPKETSVSLDLPVKSLEWHVTPDDLVQSLMDIGLISSPSKMPPPRLMPSGKFGTTDMYPSEIRYSKFLGPDYDVNFDSYLNIPFMSRNLLHYDIRDPNYPSVLPTTSNAPKPTSKVALSTTSKPVRKVSNTIQGLDTYKPSSSTSIPDVEEVNINVLPGYEPEYVTTPKYSVGNSNNNFQLGDLLYRTKGRNIDWKGLFQTRLYRRGKANTKPRKTK